MLNRAGRRVSRKIRGKIIAFTFAFPTVAIIAIVSSDDHNTTLSSKIARTCISRILRRRGIPGDAVVFTLTPCAMLGVCNLFLGTFKSKTQ